MFGGSHIRLYSGKEYLFTFSVLEHYTTDNSTGPKLELCCQWLVWVAVNNNTREKRWTVKSIF